MTGQTIVDVHADNVDEYGFFCVNNPKHPGYIAKHAWLQKRFDEGLRIKLLRSAEGKSIGFIEYIPGPFAWRAVHAEDFMVIHCIWVKTADSGGGLASALLAACAADAESSGMRGVATVASDGPWMAGRELFLKNGFELADEAPPHFQLLVRQENGGPRPYFPRDWDARRKRHKKLRLIYTSQCPYIAKAALDLPPVAKSHGTCLELLELEDAAAARAEMLSPYGVFSLVFRGRLLADHAISATRFRNILQKDLGLAPCGSPG